jgi:hypothetical protein
MNTKYSVLAILCLVIGTMIAIRIAHNPYTVSSQLNESGIDRSAQVDEWEHRYAVNQTSISSWGTGTNTSKVLGIVSRSHGIAVVKVAESDVKDFYRFAVMTSEPTNGQTVHLVRAICPSTSRTMHSPLNTSFEQSMLIAIPIK